MKQGAQGPNDGTAGKREERGTVEGMSNELRRVTGAGEGGFE